MPDRSTTRQRVIRTAADLFRVQGYHATGLTQVLTEGGLPKGSLYFHFPGGKEQLAVESVQLAGAEFGAALAATLASTPDPAEALERAVAALGEHLAATGYREGCPVATVALDTAAHNDAVRTACADVYGSWQSLVADHLRAAGVTEPDDLATVVLAAVEGALLLARTRRDVAPLRAVGSRLRVLLDNERSSL
ncbi:TetR/AcrR family transcriptional regulator [Pseudonocardia xinjiangensis]|uniref:TetR/AcrR family transcriptional regulator n=1 Tax=Pseudonocardia xinjiangensis TaxID=75289 RepID=A0ABX1RGZ8_9PSEU|nr:TetR/AcrR family transcriptional regulator [Pseudonocardia xinjiangensis]NMH79101.1 TetR/AcrR family transcriptional regulator [Pseudonocardia xinjiangensis]